MLEVDKNGWITNFKIVKEPRSAIEHSPLICINAVVVHRTNSATAQAVLDTWKKRQEGTHFLISENGKIFQTASIKKQCWHTGQIYARCAKTKTCSVKDAKAIEKILHKKNTGWRVKYNRVAAHEKKKLYPDRFPHNHDSLGIEVVGVFSKAKKIYEIPNGSQLESLFWLIDELLSTFHFSMHDIYAHGNIARKEPSEGVASLDAYTIRTKDSLKGL